MRMTLQRWLDLACMLVAVAGSASQGTAAELATVGEGRLVVEPGWPKEPHGPWAAVPGIAIDDRDRVYVFTRSRPALQIYEPDGTGSGSWPVENCDGAHQVRIAPDGTVWLVDFRMHVVDQYDRHGRRLMRLGQWGDPGSDQAHFKGPTDVVVLPGGELFVSDGYGNRRVVHFDAEGRFVNQWGEEGKEPGQFALPHSIVADSQRRLYVADRNNGRIQVFDTQGKLLAVWDHGIIPWGLWINGDDTIWVCGSSQLRKGDGWTILPPPGQLALKLSPDGKVRLRIRLSEITSPPGKPGEVSWVHMIAADSTGAIYLGDIEGKRIQKFSLQEQ